MTKPAATKPVVTPKPMTPAKSASEYLSSAPTDNQTQFLAWIYAETGMKFANPKERAAFETGVRAAGLYSRYQASKRPAK